MNQPPDLAIPVLPSRSLPAALEFYRRLGFAGEIHPHGNYAILKRGTVELHLFHHPELQPARSDAGCYLRVADAVKLHREWAVAGLPPRGIPRQEPLADKPWGMREFAIVDADGNLLRVGQPCPP
jgi:catechol 2,3-dioxygenase-like lactoylglutathione lyase family enzyme